MSDDDKKVRIEGYGINLSEGRSVFLAAYPSDGDGLSWFVKFTSKEGTETKFRASDEAMEALAQLWRDKHSNEVETWVLKVQSNLVATGIPSSEPGA